MGVTPVLVVFDLFESIDFYQHKLGFSFPQLFGQPPTGAILDRDGFQIYLESIDFEVTVSPGGFCWDVLIRVNDVWAERAVLRQLGVCIDREPTVLIDGIRKREVMEITDPNGYTICFEQQSWLTGLNQQGNDYDR